MDVVSIKTGKTCQYLLGCDTRASLETTRHKNLYPSLKKKKGGGKVGN